MKSMYCFIIALTFCCIGNAQKIDTIFHSVVRNGYVIGQQKSWQSGKDLHYYTYSINDRGRGIDVKEAVKTDAEGRIISVETNGVDYYKAPYSSSFAIVGDSAITVVNGVRKSEKYHIGFYPPSSAPGVRELWLKWIFKQPNSTIITPEDTIVAKEPSVYQFTIHGKTISLKFISQPTLTWVTEDMRLIAIARTGLIQKDYEPLLDTLLSIQNSFTANPQKTLFDEAKQLSSHLPGHLLITNSNLFLSPTADVKKNMSVEVKNGIIVSIFPSGTKSLQVDTIIDAKGKFLMPGLWDMHSHYYTGAGLWYIAGGVTHVRDMKTTDQIVQDQKRIRANELIGPDISFTSGMIDKEDPLQSPGGTRVQTLEKALVAIDEFKKSGYNQIKFYSSLKPEWVKPMADYAHKLGMRVSGHVPAYMTAEHAIKAGYDEINHLNMLFLNFLGADTLATNGIARIRVPGLLSHTVNLSSKKVQAFLSLLKAKSVVVDPTLRIQEGMFKEFQGDLNNAKKHILTWMPDTSDIRKTSSIAPENEKKRYQASFSHMLKMVNLLYKNGVTIVPGTDGGNAFALHRELELYNEAGIPAGQVLKIATYNSAKASGLEHKYGQIALGREADFILIDGDPTKDITILRKVNLVIKNGRMYSPKKLYEARGWKYYY